MDVGSIVFSKSLIVKVSDTEVKKAIVAVEIVFIEYKAPDDRSSLYSCRYCFTTL